MSALARLTEERQGGVPIAILDGEVDAANAVHLGDGIRALLSNDDTLLVIDPSRVGYIDSAGLNMLFTLADELRERQQELRLVVPEDAPIARTLEITGLGGTIRTEGDRRSALREASAG